MVECRNLYTASGFLRIHHFFRDSQVLYGVHFLSLDIYLALVRSIVNLQRCSNRLKWRVLGSWEVTLCEILVAVFLPPLGVWLKHGCCTVEFCICLLLTLLGYIPGIIYALYAIVYVDRDRFRGDYYCASP